MNHFIDVDEVSKVFKVNKRSKGIPGMMANMIRPKYEQKIAVNKISFSIDEGEMVGFIGPNGAGKSTTIKMLSGILYPDSGKINVGGYVPYKQRKEYVGNIGVVFGQKSQLQWDLPPIDSFELLRYIYRIPQDQYKKMLDRYVELLDMGSFLKQSVRQLSLGQRMRADIVAALLHSPKIVFFDEPTIGVDVIGKETIRNFIRELNDTDGITMLFTTHDMQDIEKTCKRLIVIDEGSKVYDGSLTGIRDKYSTTRQITVEFAQNVEVEPIKDVIINQLDESDGRKKRFIFENRKVEINELMSTILNKYQVKDIQISEPEIDSIIRRIYSGERIKDDELV
ncbi:MAG TPA: ATP-binding cassette domain-containing protein [Lachnospiraceae bacterium]|nr:ATP-binding cassette domain-containing protein [Lachnospiraceae bacterium]